MFIINSCLPVSKFMRRKAASRSNSKTEGDFANTGGKDSLKTTEVKADHKDGADASAKKSPVVAAKK